MYSSGLKSVRILPLLSGAMHCCSSRLRAATIPTLRLCSQVSTDSEIRTGVDRGTRSSSMEHMCVIDFLHPERQRSGEKSALPAANRLTARKARNGGDRQQADEEGARSPPVIAEHHPKDAREQLLQVTQDDLWVLGLAQDLEQIVVPEEVEPGQGPVRLVN